MTRRSAAPSGRSRLGRPLSLLAAPILAVPLLTGVATPSGAAPDPDGASPHPVVSALPGGDAGTTPITLVTGDRVLLQPAADGRDSAVVESAPRPSGQEPEFEVLDEGDDLYVIPSDAAALIPDRLDRELFNVTKLADYGYTDGVSVIVTDAPARAAAATTDEGLSVTSRLPSVDGYAATVEPDGDWWSTIAPASGGFMATSRSAESERVWLDELTEISLDESVPMIGAPDAWASGYDGTGTTVAVLDTGVDADHPDLVGQIAGTANFTADSGITDQHGHGTHVASTIAGTGAGSNGQYTGVAPGADLLIGKICNASGTCPTSGTINAMEWAAPRADVINMSIGTNVGDDGTSLSAMAINDLSEQYPHTLFVVAAGNNGPRSGTVASPGSADAALTVGAVDKEGNLASFSSRGPRLGNYAIKPDVTAPGVAIAAARATGTSMGTPVNELYTSANGTSMASPHVAGAAAIAMQHDPELTAKQIKAELVGTGDPNPDLSVYEQGGGLVDIPEALGTTVLASPEPLNMGFFAYPQGDAVTEKTVTYTNRGDAEVTLNLALDVTHEAGTATPETELSVTPAALTVPAGGTATATVRLNASNLPAGVYGGYLTARGGADVHTPVGFYIEPEMVDLTLTATARDGRPAARSSSVYVADARSPNAGYELLRFENGVAQGRFMPGDYYLLGSIRTMDGDNRYLQDRTMISAPTLRLTENTTLDFDAREAKPIEVETPDHPHASPVGQQQKTVVAYGGPEDADNFAPQFIGKWMPLFVLESGPAELNDLELAQTIRMADPALEVRVVSPEERDLFIYPLPGTPEIDGSTDRNLVYVGHGTEADYDGVDVAGKAVLVLRTPGASDYSSVEATARAHGAEAVLVMNHTSGYSWGSAKGAQIPTMTIKGEDGQRLREQLDDGPVVVNVSGTSWSPYLYDVTLLHTGGLPDGLHEVVRTEDLVTVHNSFHGEPDEPMGEYRALWRPYQIFSAQQVTPIKGARQRTDYVTAGTDSLYRQAVFGQSPLESGLQERDTLYPEVVDVSHDWFRGVMHPTVLDPAGPRNPGNPVTRTGDTLTLVLPEWSDSSGSFHYGYRDSSTDTTPTKVWVDGTYLGRVSRPRLELENLPQGDSTVRFELSTTRNAGWWQTSTKTLTNWTVHTSRPSDTALVPLMVVDYDTQLGLTNTAVPPSDRQAPAVLDLHVRHQAGYEGGQVAGAKVWISYDDGATWEKRPVMKQAGAGNFRAVLDSPAAEDTRPGTSRSRWRPGTPTTTASNRRSPAPGGCRTASTTVAYDRSRSYATVACRHGGVDGRSKALARRLSTG